MLLTKLLLLFCCTFNAIALKLVPNAVGEAEGDQALFVAEDIKAHKYRASVHLLSFRSCSQNKSAPCNAHLFDQLSNLSNAASKIPSINKHHLFQGLPREIMEDPRWAKHLERGTVRHDLQRGRGYWFWKPALFNFLVLNKTFQDGDVVIWSDPDFQTFFTTLSSTAWEDHLGIFQDQPRKIDIFVKRMELCEYKWTKQDIFIKFGTTWSNPQYGLTKQAHAQFFIVSVNERTRMFMKMWEKLMEDFHLCSDEPSIAPNNDYFKENRHDQSILSILLKAQAPTGLESRTGCNLLDLHEHEVWKRHPDFGIPGLVVHVGDFEHLLREVHKARFKDLKVKVQPLQFNSDLKSVQRTICIKDDCRSLDAV